MEDIGHPGVLRSVGRLLHVNSDGTFLLKLKQPKNGTYGFMISRGSTGIAVNTTITTVTTMDTIIKVRTQW